MNKSEVIQALETNYGKFIKYVNELTLDEYEFCPMGKWSAGQQTEHLIKSTSPLNRALSIPKFILSLKFGKANRASKSYEGLVAKYKLKLENQGKAPERYTPKVIKGTQREKLSSHLDQNIKTLCAHINNWTEKDLDKYILPHPLLGKVTIREILYFTIYHAQHHKILVKQYLKGV